MNRPAIIADPRAQLAEIEAAAQNRPALAALFVDSMGLECVDLEEDDGTTSAAEIADILRGLIRQACMFAGIDCADVFPA